MVDKPSISISVIIPAYSLERFEDLEHTIKTLLTQTLKPHEIIVAIDHNYDLLTKLQSLNNPHIKVVINSDMVGGAETRNVGMYHATGEVVAFIDDDAWAKKDWLEHLIEPYRDPSVIAVGGKTISTWEEKRPSWFPEELDWLVGGTWKGHPEGPCEVRNLIGPNMSFRLEVCKTIGYMIADLGALGTQFRAGDETEFYIRMKHYFPDHKILYEPKALVYHNVPQDKVTPIKLCLRSYSLGYHKGHLTSILQRSTSTPISEEKNYLSYLILEAIPTKLKQKQLRQTLAIGTGIVFTGLGYLRGRGLG